MYHNLLTRIKNSSQAKKESLILPFSKMDFAVAKTLQKAKYLKDVNKKIINRKNFIEIKLAYENKLPVINNFKIISKPSRHIYRPYRDLKAVKSGYGVGVISTPSGILSNIEARRKKVGGEYLFEVW